MYADFSVKRIKALFRNYNEYKASIKSRFASSLKYYQDLKNEPIYSLKIGYEDKPSDVELKKKLALAQRDIADTKAQMDEIDRVMRMYDKTQKWFPVHYEITNQVYLQGSKLAAVASTYKRSKLTCTEMSNAMFEIIHLLCESHFSVEDISLFQYEDIISLINNADLINEIEKREYKLNLKEE